MRIPGIFLFILQIGIVTGLGQEVQIPFDTDGRHMTLTQQLESRLNLFPEYTGFREARMFQTGDDTYYVEITHLSEGRIIRDRIALTRLEMIEIRQKVDGILVSQQRTQRLNQEGRGRFLRTTTSLGALYYGWAIPLALDFNAQSTVGFYMFGTGLSFYIPFLATRDADVSLAMADLSAYGGTRGIVHGHALYSLLSSSTDRSNNGLLLGTAFSVTELALGYHYAKKENLSRGRAGAIGLGGDYGLFSGFMLGSAIFQSSNAEMGGLLLGSALGTVFMATRTRQEHLSTGDVQVMKSAGTIAGLGAYTAAYWLGDRNGRISSIATVIGAGAGLYRANRLLHDYDFMESQGSIIWLSTLGGLAMGSGLAYTFTGLPDNRTENSVYLGLSTLGAITGFTIMYRYFQSEARIVRNSQSFNTYWEINPFPVASLVSGNNEFMIPGQLFRFGVKF